MTERSPKFFAFLTCEIGADHRHSQELLLKEWNSQSPLKNWDERRMRVSDRLFTLAALQIRICHLADDWPRANQRYLHNQIVEPLRVVPRQRRHLRARFDLKHAYRIRLANGVVNVLLVWRQMGEIDLLFIVFANQINGFLDRGHHAQAKEIDFDNTEISAIVFVPLHHDSSRH